MEKDDKLKALDAAITQIEKAYGKGSVMKLGAANANMNIDRLPEPGHRPGAGRRAQGEDRGDLRPGIRR